MRNQECDSSVRDVMAKLGIWWLSKGCDCSVRYLVVQLVIWCFNRDVVWGSVGVWWFS
jgi:hypothetical protein